MKMINLKNVAQIEISNVDKKTVEGEQAIRLCNFTDVYYNWAITSEMIPELMEATAKESQIDKFSLHKGQVAITKDSETRDDIGVAAYIADDMSDVILGYHCILISPNEKLVNGKYLNVIFHSPYAQKYFEANASGSGQRYTLTNEIVGDFPIPIIEFEKQRQIGNLFSDIDKKIFFNNSICSDLESMAKLLYDYWFVQFDFPDENGKPYKSSGGKMVWNEELKREIPEGWEVDKFDNIVASLPKTKSIMAPDYKAKGSYPIIDQASNLITGYTDDDSYLFDNDGCVVFGDVTTCFKYINFPFAKGTDGTKIIKSKNNRIPALLFYHLIKDCRLPNVGFARHYLFLREIKVLIPSSSVCSLYHLSTKAMMDKRKECIEENQQLSSLRDFLLPMLMNGQVKVK